MRPLTLFLFILPLAGMLLFACSSHGEKTPRQPVDTVGFAHTPRQMDTLVTRIEGMFSKQLKKVDQRLYTDRTPWKTAICPHDDYTYAGWLYPAVLKGIKAKTVFMFGVAHKARKFNLEQKIVFGTYKRWKGPYGNVTVSPARDEIIKLLPENSYVVHDSMQTIEHSLEAIIPFMQQRMRGVQIVPVLVPYMSYEKMFDIAKPLAAAIKQVADEHHWKWGTDYAIVISTDAVHYGDEDWGGSNYAPYGTDDKGTKEAVAHEHEIIDSCLQGPVDPAKILKFTRYTVDEKDFKKYKWTWCGRYSVPFGLLTSWQLAGLNHIKLNGDVVGYANSIDHPRVPVSDLKMGITAPANMHHWVGYAAVGYR